jgi:hypothetical protein
LGKVKVIFNTEAPHKLISDELFLFSNDYSYLEPEFNFEKSASGAKTLYFMKQQTEGWRPFLIAQIDKSNSELQSDSQNVMIIDSEGSSTLYRE